MSPSRFLKNIGFALTKGNSLTFSSKPSDYTTNTSTEDTQPNSVPVIQWGHKTKLDSDKRLPRSLQPGYTAPETTVFPHTEKPETPAAHTSEENPTYP